MIGGAAGPARLKLPLPLRMTGARALSEMLEDLGHVQNPKLCLHKMVAL